MEMVPPYREPIRTRTRSRDQLDRSTARVVGLVGFLLAACLPFLLWHRAISAVANDFRLVFNYLLTGWLAYGLIVVGLMFFVPVLISIGRDPDSRLYPRSRNAWAGWGVSCYLLGAALATQVAQIAAGPGAH
jgi:hypothetical protein